MTKKYFRKPSQQRGITSPNINTPLRNIGTSGAIPDTGDKARRVINAINSIGNLASKGVTYVSDVENEKVKNKAKGEVSQGMDKPGNETWKSNLAFNRFKGEALASKAPSFIENAIKNGEKPLADMTDEELEVAHAEARKKYLEQYKDKPYAQDIDRHLNEIAPRINTYILGKRDKIRQGQAKELIQNKARELFATFKNKPKDFEEMLNNYKEIARAAMTQGSLPAPTDNELKQVFMEAMMVDAMNGDRHAANYVTSKSARKKFEKVQGFGETLERAKKQIADNRREAFAAAQKADKDRLYDTLLTGGWKSNEAMEDAVKRTRLSPKAKYDLIKKFSKAMETERAGNYIVEALMQPKPNPTPYLTATPKQQEKAFEMMSRIDTKSTDILRLGIPDDESIMQLAVTDPKTYREVSRDLKVNMLTEFARNSLGIPKSIKKSINRPVNNGDIDTLSSQLALYQRVNASDAGATGIIFNNDTIAKLEMFSSLLKDSSVQDRDGNLNKALVKDRLDAYDRATRKDSYGRVDLTKMRLELDKKENKKDSLDDELLQFSNEFESGFSIFGMSQDDNLAADYGKTVLTNSYLLNRLSGKDQEDALKAAKKHFEESHSRVEFEGGMESVLPKEWSGDGSLAQKLVLLGNADANRKVIERTLKNPKYDPENLYLVPQTANERDNKMKVMYGKGEFTGIILNKESFDLMAKRELERINREASEKGTLKRSEKSEAYLKMLKNKWKKKKEREDFNKVRDQFFQDYKKNLDKTDRDYENFWKYRKR